MIYVVHEKLMNAPIAAFTKRRECVGWLLGQNILNSSLVYVMEDGLSDEPVRVVNAVEFCQ